jgi:hypothetical protein
MLTYSIIKFVRFLHIMVYVQCTVTITDCSNKFMSGNINQKNVNQKYKALILNFL